MTPEIILEESKEKVVAKLAEEIISIIKQSDKDKIHIALSGGNTPKALHEFIAQNYTDSVDWDKVYFWWGDERCVPPEDDDSNYKMAKETLLDDLKIPENNIFRIKGEVDPEEEVKEFRNVLQTQLPFENSLPVFDIILLGLGEDGHTASIFPNQIELFHSNDLAEVAVHPDSKQIRITLTGDVINNAKNVFFLVTGTDKSKVIGEIVNKEGNYKSYPASFVSPINGNLIWYLDKLAAEKI